MLEYFIGSKNKYNVSNIAILSTLNQKKKYKNKKKHTKSKKPLTIYPYSIDHPYSKISYTSLGGNTENIPNVDGVYNPGVSLLDQRYVNNFIDTLFTAPQIDISELQENINNLLNVIWDRFIETNSIDQFNVQNVKSSLNKSLNRVNNINCAKNNLISSNGLDKLYDTLCKVPPHMFWKDLWSLPTNITKLSQESYPHINIYIYAICILILIILFLLTSIIIYSVVHL